MTTEKPVPEKSPAPAGTDNRLLAILAMNIAALCATGLTSTYRIIAKEGFHAADFNLLRNFLAITVAIIWCACIKANPIKQFPSARK
mmetsp:Transcript_37287/g.49054  ORF Transcript_37287/g.49054 Transcript_37287/m.49054 type:complete len:87 (-) Transcript_37287:333-593(-)